MSNKVDAFSNFAEQRISSALQLSFPSPSGSPEPCIWNGSSFWVDGKQESILAYDTAKSGWTDDLTTFHENVAGESHYIDIASRRHTIKALGKRIKPDAVLIDIGCSSGAMLRSLRKHFPSATLIGSDCISGPLKGLARSLPGVPFLQFNLLTCPLPSSCVDGAVLLNVLEHIEDDSAALAQVFRITKPGGVVAIEVPAGPHLYDIYDKQLMHFRRYTLEDLSSKVSASGFEIEERTHLGAVLYPLFAWTKKRNQRFIQESDEVQRRIVANNIARASSNPLMNLIMRTEERLRSFVRYPVGIRCLITCRKPQTL